MTSAKSSADDHRRGSLSFSLLSTQNNSHGEDSLFADVSKYSAQARHNFKMTGVKPIILGLIKYLRCHSHKFGFVILHNAKTKVLTSNDHGHLARTNSGGLQPSSASRRCPTRPQQAPPVQPI